MDPPIAVAGSYCFKVFADHLAQLGKPLKPGDGVKVIGVAFVPSALMV
jgi:hypothetical protein